ILGLKGFDSKSTALVDVSRWADQLGSFTGSSGAGEIKLTSYTPNHLVYESNSTEEQLAVFSEIFYPHGWKMTIDGNEADYFRCNYVLRCAKIPAGMHKIEFRFEPDSYFTGEKISLAGSVLLVLSMVGGIAFGAIRLKKEFTDGE
ncbi:MAG: YfhO family protein, partial [Bacteroidota bacterium]|nr:YfhO family protein [Bacteroidota bacterium]MDX5431126.1 YfhO family protein [Bacteroidota bacterium]MDX5469875.1 YfhO family protein [Bacteroidota bacterium]